jgi:hypothetical protein
VLEAEGQRRGSTRHMSANDRPQIKYLYVVTVSDYTNPMTMYSVCDLGCLGIVWTMFTNLTNHPINRSSWDHPTRERVYLLLNSLVSEPSHSGPSAFALFVLCPFHTLVLVAFVLGVKDLGL